jgi:hypothetical protein
VIYKALCLQSRHFKTWATFPVHFAPVILKMGISWTICPGWPWTMILLISASQVVRITSVSHQCTFLIISFYFLDNIHEHSYFILLFNCFWTGYCYVPQVDLKLTISLPLPLEHWNYRYVSPCPSKSFQFWWVIIILFLFCWSCFCYPKYQL